MMMFDTPYILVRSVMHLPHKAIVRFKDAYNKNFEFVLHTEKVWGKRSCKIPDGGFVLKRIDAGHATVMCKGILEFPCMFDTKGDLISDAPIEMLSHILQCWVGCDLTQDTYFSPKYYVNQHIKFL